MKQETFEDNKQAKLVKELANELKSKQETLEEAFKLFKEEYPILKSYNLHHLLQAARFGAKWQQGQYTIEEQHIGHTIDELDKEYIKGFNEGSTYYIERMYSAEEVRKSLLDIVLVNPAHISLLKSGYGQFPDTFELTEKGVDYIVEQFKKNKIYNQNTNNN